MQNFPRGMLSASKESSAFFPDENDLTLDGTGDVVQTLQDE